jgi:hypothetical protein
VNATLSVALDPGHIVVVPDRAAEGEASTLNNADALFEHPVP